VWLAVVAAALAHGSLVSSGPGVQAVWPLDLMVAGFVFAATGFWSVSEDSLAFVVGGCTLATIGALLWFQVETAGYAFWLLAFPLPVLAASAGAFAFGTLRGDPRIGDYAFRAMLWSGLAFLALAGLGWLYEWVIEGWVRGWAVWTVVGVIIVLSSAVCVAARVLVDRGDAGT
jgi:hypothetical protein